MIKVAHFIDSLDPGGAESIVIDLCLQSRQHNLSVEILHFGNEWLERKCHEHNLLSVKVPYLSLYKSIFTLPLFSILFSIYLKRRHIDIIHTHLYDPVVATFPASFLSRIPHIATLHDVYAIENNRGKQFLLKLSSMFNSKIVAVSAHIIQHLDKSGILKRDSVVLVKNGVDLNLYSSTTHTMPSSLENVGSNDVLIASVGRLVAIKDYASLLRHFYSASKECSSLRMIIIGDGPEMESLTRLALSLGIDDKVSFLGHRDDVSSLLQQSDIFALASLSEGLSCSIIEAMASGLPVVATDVGGNSELIKDGINGYLINEDDSNMFSQRLLELALDREKRIKFGSMSSAIAKSEFSTESMCNKYIDLYNQLLTAR